MPRDRILDPGAGAGALFATCVETLISKDNPPISIAVAAFETDCSILPHLKETLKKTQALCASKGIEFSGIIRREDFVLAAIFVGEAMPGQESIDAIIEDEVDPLMGITPMTEVWIADSPTHLIHFNGERFLGPYDEGDF